MNKMTQNNKETGLEIAVIGMVGRFPGARNLDEYWENSKNGVEAITFFSDQELEEAGTDLRQLRDPGYVKAYGELDHKEYFDLSFFGYSPKEAEVMDPQIRLFHESAWEVLENAGYDPSSYGGSIGVYAGASDSFLWRALSVVKGMTQSLGLFASQLLNNSMLLSTRISHKLDLKGPSITMFNACSTSLVSIHLACRALLTGECDIALAGAVSAPSTGKNGYVYEEGMIFSPDGHCRTFDARGKGTVYGEGLGILALKRLREAIEDGDTIHGVIKGTAMNNDGLDKASFAAPGSQRMADVIRTALKISRVDPRNVSYVEAHGTATALGDSIEFNALSQAFAAEKKNYCRIGSVKTNIGHLDVASGFAGMIKMLLAFKHKLIPPSLHFEEPNSNIDFVNSPFRVNTELTEWDDGYPLTVGVNGFGIGGTNSFVILEEAPLITDRGELTANSRDHQLILVSARTESALEQATTNLCEYFKANPGIDLANAAYTLQVGRKGFKYRRMTVCKEIKEAIEVLATPASRKLKTFLCQDVEREVVFMFPGLGSQYVNMGRGLYQSEPVFREEMDRCFRILEHLMEEDIKAILYPGNRESEVGQVSGGNEADINHTEITQPVLFIFEYALAKLLMSWGITPKAMIGYSLGEYTAACISGVFSLEEALQLIVSRGELVKDLPPGIMLNVPLPENQLKPLLEEFTGNGVDSANISLAIDNGPSCVVAGAVEVIEEFEKWLRNKRCMCMRIQTSRAIHSHMMEPVLEKFIERVSRLNLKSPQIPYISNVTADWLKAQEALEPGYWAKHLRQTVRFAEGVRELVKNSKAIFIEVGPGRDLSALLRRHLDEKKHQQVLNLIRQPEKDISDVGFLLTKIGQFWLYGGRINWAGFYNQEKRQRIPLPTYPFQQQRFSSGGNLDKVASQMLGGGTLIGQADSSGCFHIPSWRRSRLPGHGEWQNMEPTDWLVFLDEMGWGLKLVQQLKNKGQKITIIRNGEAFRKVNDWEYIIRPGEAKDYQNLFKELLKYEKFPSRMIHLWNITEIADDELEIRHVEELQDLGYYSLLNIAQSMGWLNIVDDVRIMVVSNNVQEVFDENRFCPGKATLIGAVKGIPKEYDNIRLRSIDVLLPEPETPQEDKLVDQLLDEFVTEAVEPVIAYRSSQRWLEIYESVSMEKHESHEKNKKNPLREKGSYLITGGLGGIGLVLAEYLAKEVPGVKLILFKRSQFLDRDQWEPWLNDHDEEDPTSKIIKKIQGLEALGAEVFIGWGEMGDFERIRQLIAQAQERFGPINGVIHSAGIPDGAMIQIRTRENSERIFMPKLNGTLILDKILNNGNLDFFVLCSSMDAIMSATGQVGYCAANIFLNTYSKYNERRSGPFTVSINWPRWQSLGMAVIAEQLHKNLKGVDLTGGMTTEEGVEAFSRILENRLPQVAVFSYDLMAAVEHDYTAGTDAFMEEFETVNQSETLCQRPELTSEYVAPRNEIEKKIARIWQDLFGFEQVGIKDDFFELGGDSLKVVIVISKIHKELNVEIPISEFFSTPNIGALSNYINQGEASTNTYSEIKPVEEKEYYGLSSPQRRLYILQQLEVENTAYNETEIVLIVGKLDKNRLEQAFKNIIHRHEIFRTSIQVVEGKPVQKIHNPQEIEFVIEYYEGSKAEAQELAEGFARPFDLSQAPLLRIGLITLKNEKYILMVDIHHIITDKTSYGLFFKEFLAFYQGEDLPAPSLQYRNYTEWQKSEEQQAAIKAQEEFWLKQFEGELPVLELPYDYPRPKNHSYIGNGYKIIIEKQEIEALGKLALEENVTLYMVFLSIFNIFLSKLSGQEDIVVGTPVAGRRHEGLQNLMGLFVDTLALRAYPREEKTYKEFLQEIRETTLRCFDNQDYPFEELANRVKGKRDMSRTPLFDVLFVMQNVEDKPENVLEQELTDFKFMPYFYETLISRFDLMLEIEEEMGHSVVTLQHSTKLFKEETIDKFTAYFKKIISSVLKDKEQALSEIEIMSEEEKKQVLYDFNDPDTDYPKEKTIHELIEQQAAKSPGNIAVLGVDASISPITYKELNQRANQMARMLRKNGVTAESVVGIIMEPSVEMMIALSAILKAGGAYLPIEPHFPAERVRFMLEDSGAKIILIDHQAQKQMSFTALQNFEVNHQVQIQITPPRHHINDFDRLPMPDRSLVHLKNYRDKIGMASVTNAISLQATRGCPYKCVYCHKVWSKHHVFRSAENIYEEVQYYYKKGVRNFAFIDDCFNLNRENSTRFFQLVIKNKLDIRLFFPNGLRGDLLTPDYIDLMVEAGTRGINLSLETASPRLQKVIKKYLDIEKFKQVMDYISHQHPNVILELATMHGFPGETEEEAYMTLDFIKSIHWIHFPYIHILKVYPNTEMEALALEQGISPADILASKNLAFHELPETLPFPKSFTRKYQMDFMNEYFLSKARLQKVLPVQMQVLSSEALVQKYDTYLPFDVKSIKDIMDFSGLNAADIPHEYSKRKASPPEIFNWEPPDGSTVPPSAKKILLLDLSQHFSSHSMLYNVSEQPLGLISILTVLKREFGDQIDGRIYKSGNDFDSHEELKQLVEAYQPDLVGIRTLTFYREFFHETAALLRQWGIHVPVIAGGPYATSDYNSILKDENVNLAVLGESESTMRELVEKMLENDFKIPSPAILKTINGLAFAERGAYASGFRQVIQVDRLFHDNHQQDPGNPEPITNGSNLAYVMYTSGSTGEPKGVMVEHRSVNNCIWWMQNKFNLSERDMIAQRTNLSFDPSVWEIFWPLSIGGAVKIIAAHQRKDGDFLIRLMEEDTELTMMYCPATLVTVMTYLLNSRAVKPVLKLPWLIIGAEPISKEVVKNFYDYFADRIVNTYGPTECTINNTYYDLLPEDPRAIVPIGKPVANNQLHILSPGLQLQPLNVPGEICISGDSVARGYINNVGKTAGNFIDNPFGPGKLYKSGDIGRWLEDGNIEIMGRVDDQFKIRGYRIEPGEIEAPLRRHPAIKNCAVLVRDRQESQAEVRVCKTCGITSNYPGVEIDIEEETCEMCQNLDRYKQTIDNYFKTLAHLEQLIREANKDKKRKYHCLLLYSGGRGAAYALYQLQEMGFNVLAATYDHGYYSKKDLQNIKKITSGLGVDHIVFTHPHTGDILKESLKTAHTVCRGCFHTSSSLAREYAYQNDIPVVVGATLSRGQIIENKLFMFLQQGITQVQELEKEIANLQTEVMEIDKNMFDFIDIDVVQRGLVSEKVKTVDFYRYCNITNNQMIADLNRRDPHWKSRKNYAIYSTNCPIKQIGDYAHLQANGFHFYGSATSWEKRLHHLTLENAAEDLTCHVTRKGYENFLKLIGYPYHENKKAAQEDKYLCAYIVSDNDSTLPELREYLAGELPDYMIPSYFVPLEEIPLLSNGKVDRRALPQWDPKAAGDQSGDYTAPRDEVENKLVEIWSEVLGIQTHTIGIDRNFFDLGGHSLRAIVMTSQIHKELDVRVPMTEIFRKPTVKELAEHIKESVEEKYAAIQPSEKKEFYPLSSAQKRMYFAQQMEPNSTTYNIPEIVPLDRGLDKERLADTIKKLINRHESLRTSFEMVGGEPVQKIQQEVEFEVSYDEVEDFESSLLPGSSHHSSLLEEEKMVQHLLKPFDPGQAPLLRVKLIKVGDIRYILMINLHHIVTDGVSMGILVNDFNGLYQGNELSPLRICYKDYAEWQNRELESGILKKQEAYWLQQFSGNIPVLDLPIDYPRPEILAYTGDIIDLEMDNALTKKITRRMKETEVTLNILLLAAYHILLAKYSGQEDIVVGIALAGRRHADLQQIIGMFVNMFPIRSQPAENKTFSTLLADVKQHSIDAYENQDYQFDDLVARLGIHGNQNRNPLFDTVFIVQSTLDINNNDSSPIIESTNETILEIPHTELRNQMFDLIMEAMEVNDVIRISLRYSTELFNRSTAQQMARHYIDILNQVVENPDLILEEITITHDFQVARSGSLQESQGDFRF